MTKLSMNKDLKKIRIKYPDGHIDCDHFVVETYRRALEYVGLEKVRLLNIEYNSRNIVSTADEIKAAKGKKEGKKTFKRDSPLKICTQFDTDCKYKILQRINHALGYPFTIDIVDQSEVRTTSNCKSHTICINELETDESKKIEEGMAKEYHATRYERNQTARQLCIRHYGSPVRCQICGFDFEKIYGPRDGKSPFIEVHHIQPLGEMKSAKKHAVDYTKDLIPVCSNCHRMLHHFKPYTLTPKELKDILASNKNPT